MRIGPQPAIRHHAVARFRRLCGPICQSRAFFFQREQSPEELEAAQIALERQYPLINPAAFRANPHPNPGARRVAIIGGGITGLTTAFYISKLIPAAEITIFDKRPRLGGWIESERLQVSDGDILFEWGARSLRPDITGSGEYTIDLLSRLSPDDVQLILMSKDSPASRNRFIYYGGKLVLMPGNRGSLLSTAIDVIRKLLVEPIFRGLFSHYLKSQPRPPNPAASTRDESVGDLMRRNFGSVAVNNIISAVFHGIYAGNVDKLSARTLVPRLWHLSLREEDGEGSIIKYMPLLKSSLVHYRQLRARTLLNSARPSSSSDPLVLQSLERVKLLTDALFDCSMYTFCNGLQQLSDALVSSLSANSNVTFSTSTSVDHLKYDSDRQTLTLATSPPDPNSASSNPRPTSPAFDYVVSTASPTALSSMLKTPESPSRIPERAQLALGRISHAVNVMVVNLYYTSPNILPSSLEGFGYLIPASISIDENPERALGVIFSSNSSGPRGPHAFRKVPHRTAAELRSWREDMERDYETDPGRHVHIESLARLQRLSQDDPELAAKMLAANLGKGVTLADFEKAHLKAARSFLRLQIDEVKKREKEARAREAQQDFDPNNNFDRIRLGQDTATGTKLTVMLGGHWWDDWADSDLPTEEEGIARAKSLLARHLNITEEPEVSKARLQRNCIPQYPVGNRDYLAAIHNDILSPMAGKFDGRLKVAGSWWQGSVGVNDCIRKAFETAAALREGWDECTGLEEYATDEKWFLLNRKDQVEPHVGMRIRSFDR